MNFKKILLGLFLIGMVLPLAAQPRQNKGERRERVEAFKIAFLTRELDLSPQEAKVFWPVYDAFQEEKRTLRKQEKLEKMEARLNFEDMSDNDVEETLDGFMNHKQAELDLTRKYMEEFKSVLPIRKVAKLFRAEMNFKKHLMEQLQERRGGDKGGGQGMGRGRRGPMR